MPVQGPGRAGARWSLAEQTRLSLTRALRAKLRRQCGLSACLPRLLLVCLAAVCCLTLLAGRGSPAGRQPSPALPEPRRVAPLAGQAIAVPSPKVALLFLSKGPLPLEEVWRAYFLQAAGQRAPAAVGLETGTTSIKTAGRHLAAAGRGVGALFAAGGETVRAQGVIPLSEDEQQRSDLDAAAAVDEWNEGVVHAMEAPQSALSELDPAGPVAGQDLFSVYTHTTPAYAFPKGSVFAGTQIDGRVYVHWGQFSVAEAMRRLVIAALAEPRNQRFVFLSESCAPLFPPAVVHAQLMSEQRSRVQACASPERPAPRWGMYLRVPGVLEQQHWRKSSQWISLIRQHAEAVRDDNVLWRRFALQCYSYNPWAGLTLPPYLASASLHSRGSRACVADEHYFATLLAVRGLEAGAACDVALTFTDWQGDAWSPVRYTAADVRPELVVQMRQGVWESRPCPAARAMASAWHLYAPDGNDAHFAVLSNVSAYDAMPNRCMLFGRKFSADAGKALADMADSCNPATPALRSGCLKPDPVADSAATAAAA